MRIGIPLKLKESDLPLTLDVSGTPPANPVRPRPSWAELSASLLMLLKEAHHDEALQSLPRGPSPQPLRSDL